MSKPNLSSVRRVYTQERDCCDAFESNQALKLSTDDGGGGAFVVLKTRRWAIDPDGLEDFIQVLRDFIYEIKAVDYNSADDSL